MTDSKAEMKHTGTTIPAPFPWFGGKSRVAPIVWDAFGDVKNYVEPFFGSGAVLLGRPESQRGNQIETVNDLDGFLANFWRAARADPDATAEWAGDPVNENDLHARHVWLVERREHLRSRIEGSPDFYDAKIAGWWVWGLCSWIAGGWCAGNGPWWPDAEGKLVKASRGAAGQGVKRQLPHLSTAGQGVTAWFRALSTRLASVRVASGDWSRVCGPSVVGVRSPAGIFLDPPYADTAGRDPNLYAIDSLSVAHDVRKWAVENGDNPNVRIALCGYAGEHDMPASWRAHPWKAHGGYANAGNAAGRENAAREVIWFSPHCLRPTRL